MNNKPWSKAKLKRWKDFWTSDMGIEAITKIEQIKQLCIDESMKTTDNNAICGLIGRAAGVDLVLQDIRQGLLLADGKKEGGEAGSQ